MKNKILKEGDICPTTGKYMEVYVSTGTAVSGGRRDVDVDKGKKMPPTPSSEWFQYLNIGWKLQN